MNRSTLVALAAVPALLAVPTIASAQDANTPLDVDIVAPEGTCGEATITYTSDNPRDFIGDYRVDDEPGEPDGVVDPDLLVREGPLAGLPFGPVFNPTPVPAGETVQVDVVFAEDQGDGEVTLAAWVNRGPEQRAFAANVSLGVDTDCAPPDEDGAGEGGADGPVGEDDDPAALEAELPDRRALPDAPRPTVGVADLPVTG